MGEELAVATLGAVVRDGPRSVAALADSLDERHAHVSSAVGALAARDLVATTAAGVVATTRGERRWRRFRDGDVEAVLSGDAATAPIEATAGP